MGEGRERSRLRGAPRLPGRGFGDPERNYWATGKEGNCMSQKGLEEPSYQRFLV